ncbi:hypothetical protein E9993_13770 [Labilibacter sediminis]|nr:hypothetical protein E9993_13770 [Labilibacter sediminis]
MKLSGNKIVITISAIVLFMMLIVPVLPASFFQSHGDSCCKEADDYKEAAYSSEATFVGFSIGREITISL